MSLQATMIMLDNSASSINGDYAPTRWENQVDAASLLIQAKFQANQQSSVGVALMGGTQVQILCTMTTDSVKANSFLFGIKSSGTLHFTQALQIGALSLKHRSNETQKQRLVCFVGSTITQDIETLKILAKKFKKNGIAVDIVSFGDVSAEQTAKIEAFINTVQHEDSSHTITVEPGQNLSDRLIGSEIFGGGASGNVGGNNMEQEDPELAAAIRMSLEENQRVNPVGGAQGQEPQQQQQQQQNIAHEPTQQQLEQLAIQMSLQEMNIKEDEKKEGQEQKKEQ